MSQGCPLNTGFTVIKVVSQYSIFAVFCLDRTITYSSSRSQHRVLLNVFTVKNQNDTRSYVWGPVHTAPEEFDSTVRRIRHENGTFWKRSSNRRNLKTPAFRFRVGRKHIENGALENDDLTISCDFPVGVFSNSNPKWPLIVTLSNSSGGVVWTGNIWCVFRVKPPFSKNSSSAVWEGP